VNSWLYVLLLTVHSFAERLYFSRTGSKLLKELVCYICSQESRGIIAQADKAI